MEKERYRNLYTDGRIKKIKRSFLFILPFFFLIKNSPSNASQWETFNKLSFDLKASYVSRYMFRGFDILDDRGAVQPSLTINFGETGLWLNSWSSFAVNGGVTFDETSREDLDELDWAIGYDWNWKEQLNFTTGYLLFQYPNIGSKKANINEFFAGCTFSKIPLSPQLLICYDFPVESGGPGRGFFYELILSHSLSLAPFIKQLSSEQTIDFEITVGANDGVYDIDTGGFALTYVDLSTSIPINCKFFTLKPEFHYQLSTNHAVNNEDETWFGITLSKSF